MTTEKAHEGMLLREYLKDNRITQVECAKRLEMSRQNLNDYMNKEELSTWFKEKLAKAGLEVFTISVTRDPMVDYNTSQARQIKDDEFIVMNVPLVNQYAYGGYTTGFADAEYINELPTYPFLADRNYKGNYRAFEVRGDSMDDGSKQGYCEGEVVLGRQVGRHLWRDTLHFKQWDFVIVTKSEGIVIKQIIKHDTNTGVITLHSRNPMYPDYDIALDDVLELYNVVQISSKR